MGCGGSSAMPVEPAARPGDGKSATGGSSIKKEAFIMDNPGKIHEFWDIDKKKLEGSYGAVSKCTNKATGVTRAVKSISKAQLKNLNRFKQEIAIMKIADRPNIIKLFESFEDHRNIYLVLELCTGGELFDRIIDDGHFTEVQAATVMLHMSRAISYMHENYICHRDIKPENFHFDTKESIFKSAVKLIDFGLACKFEPNQVLTTKAGTSYYMAPQVLAGKYDQSCDLWSLGVIMYTMLCGCPPFYAETDADVLAKVRLGKFSFNDSDWQNISEDAKNLIRALLQMSPSDRYTAEQTLEHAWVRNKAPNAKHVNLSGTPWMENLRGFRSQNKLKKAAMHVIASQLSESQIKNLRETFMVLDGNGDGLLTANEMIEGLNKCDLEIPADLQQIMQDIDSDEAGIIDYTDFLAATLDKKVDMMEDVCWQAFRTFDRHGNGKICKKDIALVLNDDGVQQAAKDTSELGKRIGTDGDGEIDFQEFMKMMRGAAA